jgi:hypothetical protein
MKAQDILDAEGFMPVASRKQRAIGEVVVVPKRPPSRLLEPGVKLVITGRLSREEMARLEAKYFAGDPNLDSVLDFPFFYKTVAE